MSGVSLDRTRAPLVTRMLLVRVAIYVVFDAAAAIFTTRTHFLRRGRMCSAPRISVDFWVVLYRAKRQSRRHTKLQLILGVAPRNSYACGMAGVDSWDNVNHKYCKRSPRRTCVATCMLVASALVRMWRGETSPHPTRELAAGSRRWKDGAVRHRHILWCLGNWWQGRGNGKNIWP